MLDVCSPNLTFIHLCQVSKSIFLPQYDGLEVRGGTREAADVDDEEMHLWVLPFDDAQEATWQTEMV